MRVWQAYCLDGVLTAAAAADAIARASLSAAAAAAAAGFCPPSACSLEFRQAASMWDGKLLHHHTLLLLACKTLKLGPLPLHNICRVRPSGFAAVSDPGGEVPGSNPGVCTSRCQLF
jgi:hypothetical protein